MSILSGFFKTKKYRKTDDGYKLQSEWTSSETVEMGDGNTAEENLGAIQGITSSLASTSNNFALSASAGKDLQDQISDLNTDLSTHKSSTDHDSRYYTESEIDSKISTINTDLNNKTNYPDYISSHRIPIGGEGETWFAMPTDGYVQFYYLVTGLSGIADEGVSEYTCGISGFINDGNHPIYTNNFHFTYGYNEEYWSALYPVKKGDTVMFKVLTAKVLQYAEIWLVPYR